jgi:hypothetical protein
VPDGSSFNGILVPNGSKQYNNKYASTWISAIYGGQNALQESLCEGVWMNQLLLQDCEESGTGRYR